MLSAQHQIVQDWTEKLSAHFLPRTRAYSEIWLDGKKTTIDSENEPESEPIYGATYLPRKFKIGIAIPPTNDIDVFAHDLGLIAIIQDGILQGFNVAVGGGMRSEEHTSELQSLMRISYAVFCLKKKKNKTKNLQ